MEVTGSDEILGRIYKATRRHIPKKLTHSFFFTQNFGIYLLNYMASHSEDNYCNIGTEVLTAVNMKNSVQKSACSLSSLGFLLGLHVDLKDESEIFLHRVGSL
jgi:hypothetical protein